MNSASQETDRQRCLDLITGSDAPKKLIVAGPGTGKTHTFRVLLDGITGPRLALTFINALSIDLAKRLGDEIETYTFHGFCRRLLHSTPTNGITQGVDYYPPLILLFAEDLSLLGEAPAGVDEIEHDFHHLAPNSPMIAGAMRSGDYYNAVGHIDAVYRALSHLEDHPDGIPRYNQIVVDEYQDFSLLEANFIAVLSSKNATLIVGDDDQALYGFKHASAAYIRDLAQDPMYIHFELPYCSRCTQVLVDATHTVIEHARQAGLLNNRINKRYECYLPDKQEDSDRYPQIVYAHCTVERNNAPYIGKYIHQRILDIPREDIDASRADGNPTVLITGPPQFTKRVYDYLSRYFPDVELRTSGRAEIAPLHGYRRLVRDARSRLGWRIILHTYPPNNLRDILHASLNEGEELSELLADSYRTKHLRNAELLARLQQDDPLTAEEIGDLEAAVQMPYLDLRAELKLDGETETAVADDSAGDTPGSPRIMVTTLVGAKGLQASHVFVVGLSEGHFPMSNNNVTDDEVCCLLVALTRAQKSCTIISCGRFGNQPLRRSKFLAWLNPHLRGERIDAEYFRNLS